MQNDWPIFSIFFFLAALSYDVLVHAYGQVIFFKQVLKWFMGKNYLRFAGGSFGRI